MDLRKEASDYDFGTCKIDGWKVDFWEIDIGELDILNVDLGWTKARVLDTSEIGGWNLDIGDFYS